MAGGINLATKYSREVDERWVECSQIALATSRRFDFKGDKTVVVYSIPYAPLNNYVRSGTSRYGAVEDLGRNIQTMTVTQDKGFTFVIDRGDEVQSEYVSNPGAALNREIREVITPQYDTYCFNKIAKVAIDCGNTADTVITKDNAHSALLDGIQHMQDHEVPVDDIYCFATYEYAKYLMQDPSFIRYGDRSQEMIRRGEIGMADGVKIVMVAPSRLPAGTAFLLIHKDSCIAPRQLEEYKTHVDPPGISGTLCEGRILYDCFVFDEKVDGIYLHYGQESLKILRYMTAASAVGKSKIVMNCEKEATSNKWYYKTAATRSALPTAAYGAQIDIATSSSPWYQAKEVTAKEMEITPTAGDTAIIIVETRNMRIVGAETKKLNVGKE